VGDRIFHERGCCTRRSCTQRLRAEETSGLQQQLLALHQQLKDVKITMDSDAHDSDSVRESRENLHPVIWRHLSTEQQAAATRLGWDSDSRLHQIEKQLRLSCPDETLRVVCGGVQDPENFGWAEAMGQEGNTCNECLELEQEEISWSDLY
jgi:hypothetical protein